MIEENFLNSDSDSDFEAFVDSRSGVPEEDWSFFEEDYYGLVQPPKEDENAQERENNENSDDDIHEDAQQYGIRDEPLDIDGLREYNFATEDELITEVINFAYNEGFVAHKETRKSNSQGEAVYRVFSCHRRDRSSKKTQSGLEFATDKRVRKSNQCGCKWRMQFNFDRFTGYWKAAPTQHLTHNHPPLIKYCLL